MLLSLFYLGTWQSNRTEIVALYSLNWLYKRWRGKSV